MNRLSAAPLVVDPYAGMTIMHPVMAILIVALCIAVLRIPRKYAIVPFIIAVNCIPVGQRIYVLGMNFTALRILVIAGLVRILLRRETYQLRITGLDRIVVLYAIVMTAAHVLRIGTFNSLLTALGTSLDKFWSYLVVRLLVRDLDDLRILVRTFALISLVLGVLLFYESRTGLNSFRAFGGVTNPLEVRGGRVRVQGPYGHSILAGVLWASILPLVIAYRIRGGARRPVMYLSILSIIVMVSLTESSTPVMSLAVAIAGSVLYYQRNIVPKITITALVLIGALAVFWWHPIWFLFTKFDLTGSSTSYFRYHLIDGFIRNWTDWFLIGTTDSQRWGQGLGLYGVGLGDQTNQFVLEGARGGIMALSLFLGAVGIAFNYLGRLVSSSRNREALLAYWHIGVSLVVHLTSFMGVDYFDQVTFSWWMTLGIVSSLYGKRILTARTHTRASDSRHGGPVEPELL